MGKRTPLKAGESGYAYVFLSNAGIILKIRGCAIRYSWRKNFLRLDFSRCIMAVAEYSGSSNLVYFPKVNRTRHLYNFNCYFDNSESQHCTMTFNGVEALNNPCIPSTFDYNVSTLSLLRHMRMPPPVSIEIDLHSYWSIYNSVENDKYRCKINYIEDDESASRVVRSEIDTMLESLL